MKTLVYLCTVINLAFASENLLDKFQICKRSDPKLNECLKEAIQKALLILNNGIPEFKIPSMQPMVIEEWIVKGTEVIPFDQKYKPILVYNKALSTVDEVHSLITDDDFSIHIKAYLPVLKFTAAYEFDNAIFYGHNFTGNGPFFSVLSGNFFSVNMSGTVNRSGIKPFLQIVSSFHENTIEAIDINLGHTPTEENVKASVHFSKHGKMLFESLAEGYSEIYAFAFKNIANAIFSQLDYDKLFPK